jgi:predicted oxidoreductase
MVGYSAREGTFPRLLPLLGRAAGRAAAAQVG